MITHIQQAETVAELLSYIERLEHLDITPENYREFLKSDFRDSLKKAGDLGPLVDARI